MPMNYLNGQTVALRWIAGLGIVGIILIIVGWAMNASVNSAGVEINGDNPIPGLWPLVWGGALLNIGILGGIASLVVSALADMGSRTP